MRWWIDEDEEFGGELLRWNDHVIAQTTGEEQDGCYEAYAALVEIVRAACLPLPRRRFVLRSKLKKVSA